MTDSISATVDTLFTSLAPELYTVAGAALVVTAVVFGIRKAASFGKGLIK